MVKAYSYLFATAATFSVLILACEENPTAPGEKQAPLELQARFTETYVELTWAPSVPDKETAYDIFRSTEDNLHYEKIAEVGKETHTYRDDNFRPDAHNYYKVRTMYGDHTGPFSDEVSVTTNSFWLWNAGGYTHKVYKINPFSGSVLASFNTPFLGAGSDREPSGLTWDGVKYFWHAEMISNRIYNTNETGSIRLYYGTPGDRPSGLAWAGEYLWHADNQEDTIFRLETDGGSVMSSFPSPGSNPYGLAWDGAYLWNADAAHGLIFQINPNSGSVITSFRSPDVGPTGLAWDGTYLWNADRKKHAIFKIAPGNGSVLASFPSPDLGPRGLTVQKRF